MIDENNTELKKLVNDFTELYNLKVVDHSNPIVEKRVKKLIKRAEKLLGVANTGN